MSKGIIYVDTPENISVISDESKKAAKILESLIQEFSIEPYDRIKNEGFWRILLWRESKKTKEAMLSVIVSDDFEVDLD